MENEKKGLVVTTAHKGVFFGYGITSDSPTIELENARMCVYWPEGNRGVVGLAKNGPLKGAKVGPAAPKIILRDVTAIMEATEEAIRKWESEPWI